jgi:hypothetical protein
MQNKAKNQQRMVKWNAETGENKEKSVLLKAHEES